MKRAEFGKFLHQVADAAASGDSAEGSIQWLIADDYDEVFIEAAFRTGNLQGQGGYMIHQALTDVIEKVQEQGRLCTGLHGAAYNIAIRDVVKLLEEMRGG